MDALADLAPFAQVTATGVLLAMIVYLIRTIVRGDLVPRRELDYVRADRDARVAEARREAADWRAAHETSENAREILHDQLRDVADALGTQNHFFDALRQVTGDRRAR